MELLLLYTLLMAFGLLGLVMLGIRRERQQLKRDYKEAVKLLMMHGNSRGNNRRRF